MIFCDIFFREREKKDISTTYEKHWNQIEAVKIEI
jgi:hypothetical protein